VAAQGYGYLEDRRPAANADPYLVSVRILETVCGTASQAESNGSPRTCEVATQSGNDGSARRGKKEEYQY
jgi:glutamine synthetase